MWTWFFPPLWVVRGVRRRMMGVVYCTGCVRSRGSSILLVFWGVRKGWSAACDAVLELEIIAVLPAGRRLLIESSFIGGWGRDGSETRRFGGWRSRCQAGSCIGMRVGRRAGSWGWVGQVSASVIKLSGINVRPRSGVAGTRRIGTKAAAVAQCSLRWRSIMILSRCSPRPLSESD